jgi:uncharacterized protein YecE (DUF72 family)
MDFGRVPDLTSIDFQLPEDATFTTSLLDRDGQNVRNEQIYIGAPIWSNKEWVGKIYPSTTKANEMLYHYARQFNTIELNVTHYQIPSEKTIQNWRKAVTPEFKFCPKWPQIISHDSMLRGLFDVKQEFIRNVLQLEENLGMTFLQLGPTFDTTYMADLNRFLKQIPENFPLSIEFRHPSWFVEKDKFNALLQYLHKRKIGTVITDVPGRRDVLHMGLSIPTLTLRFVGNELHPTDYTRTNDWVHRLQQWFLGGLENAYIFIHCGENTLAPELTKYWVDQLNQLLGTYVAAPSIRPQAIQGSLFT